MEFKRKVKKKRRAAAVKRKKEGGFRRIKIRGRKRWVKDAKSETAGK